MGSVLPFYDRHIDIMILSHPHFDHVFGLLKVLERYEVDKIVITGAVHTTDAYLDFLNEIKKYDVEIVEGYKKIVLNDVSYLEFLYPLTNVYGQTFKNVNDTSIVTRFVEGKTSFLFPGDVEMVSEQELVASGLELKSDVLMAPHQGSKTSSSLEFLKAVDPKLVIISVGEGNDYGHPHKEVVDRYQGLGIRYLRTDYEGTITIETNGDEYFVK